MAYFQVLFTPVTGQAFLETGMDVVRFKNDGWDTRKERSPRDVILCRMIPPGTMVRGARGQVRCLRRRQPDPREKWAPLFTCGPDSCEPAHHLYTARFKVEPCVVLDLEKAVHTERSLCACLLFQSASRDVRRPWSLTATKLARGDMGDRQQP